MWTSPAFYVAVVSLIGAITAFVRAHTATQKLNTHLNAKHSTTYGGPSHG